MGCVGTHSGLVLGVFGGGSYLRPGFRLWVGGGVGIGYGALRFRTVSGWEGQSVTR